MYYANVSCILCFYTLVAVMCIAVAIHVGNRHSLWCTLHSLYLQGQKLWYIFTCCVLIYVVITEGALFQAVGTCRLVNMFIKKFALYIGSALIESLNVVYFTYAICKMHITLSLFVTLYSVLILILHIGTYFV